MNLFKDRGCDAYNPNQAKRHNDVSRKDAVEYKVNEKIEMKVYPQVPLVTHINSILFFQC